MKYLTRSTLIVVLTTTVASCTRWAHPVTPRDAFVQAHPELDAETRRYVQYGWVEPGPDAATVIRRVRDLKAQEERASIEWEHKSIAWENARPERERAEKEDIEASKAREAERGRREQKRKELLKNASVVADAGAEFPESQRALFEDICSQWFDGRAGDQRTTVLLNRWTRQYANDATMFSCAQDAKHPEFGTFTCFGVCRSGNVNEDIPAYLGFWPGPPPHCRSAKRNPDWCAELAAEVPMFGGFATLAHCYGALGVRANEYCQTSYPYFERFFFR